MATSFANRSTILYCDSRTRESSDYLTHVTRNGVFYRSVASEELLSPIAAAATTGAARHAHRRPCAARSDGGSRVRLVRDLAGRDQPFAARRLLAQPAVVAPRGYLSPGRWTAGSASKNHLNWSGDTRPAGLGNGPSARHGQASGCARNSECMCEDLGACATGCGIAIGPVRV